MSENQVEEKSLKEYKEQKGFVQWIKSTFEKLKERFRPTRNVGQVQNTNSKEGELSEEQLDNVKAGYPDPNILDFDAIKSEIDNLQVSEPKTWDLTPEEQQKVEEGYEEIRTTNNQDEQELTAEELDDVKAGRHIINDEYSK